MTTKIGWFSVMLAASIGASAMACAPDDPFDFGGPRSCEPADQNEWIYGLMQQAYLWNEDMPELEPLDYESPAALVSELRVGHDRWSRVSDKARSDALFQEGKVVGLGFRTRRDADDRVVVATVDQDTPAAAAGLQRGDVIRSIGGLATAQIDEEERWNEVYGDSEPGVAVELEVARAGGEVVDVELVKDWISVDTVPESRVLELDGRAVGYLAFSTFVETSTAALNEAFTEFRAADVREVVVDVRYNGGGLVVVARHFMHLLVGAVAEGQVAYRVRYNDHFSEEDDDRALVRLDPSLPHVDHVVFITTGSTLSASELLINAVAPHVRVSIVGDTTGGKPVGSRHFDFCDKVAAPITFRLLNAVDYGDYYEGLPPTCAAPDDFTHPLGDEAEASLATALHLIRTGECLAPEEGEGAMASDPAGLRTRPDPAAEPQGFEELTGLR